MFSGVHYQKERPMTWRRIATLGKIKVEVDEDAARKKREREEEFEGEDSNVRRLSSLIKDEIKGEPRR